MVGCGYSLSTGEAEAGRPGAQGQFPIGNRQGHPLGDDGHVVVADLAVFAKTDLYMKPTDGLGKF